VYNNVIWDFNGTIIDDVDIGINALNRLLAKYGFNTVDSKEHYRSIFGFPIKDYYARAGFDFDIVSYETLAPLWVEDYLANEPEAPIISHVLDSISRLKDARIHQFLVSATEISMLKGQLKSRQLENCFEGVYGLDNIHASSKKDIACDVVRSLDGKTVMLGDTLHDADCAVAACADVILIAAGHQSYEKLSASGHTTVRTAKEAVDIILRS